METVDTKQLDDEIKIVENDIFIYERALASRKMYLEQLKERKKSIELYNKK